MKALLIIIFAVIVCFVALSSILSAPKQEPVVGGKLSPDAVFLYKYVKGDTSVYVFRGDKTQEIKLY